VRSSSLKEIARSAEGKKLTPQEKKTLLEFKCNLIARIREIADVKPGGVVTSETDFLFSGAALGAS
jgi:hypothetical protein